MGVVVILILVAVALLVVGLLISALKWLLIIAAIIFVIGLARGAIAGRGNRKAL